MIFLGMSPKRIPVKTNVVQLSSESCKYSSFRVGTDSLRGNKSIAFTSSIRTIRQKPFGKEEAFPTLFPRTCSPILQIRLLGSAFLTVLRSFLANLIIGKVQVCKWEAPTKFQNQPGVFKLNFDFNAGT